MATLWSNKRNMGFFSIWFLDYFSMSISSRPQSLNRHWWVLPYEIPLQLDREGIKEREKCEKGGGEGGDYSREAIIQGNTYLSLLLSLLIFFIPPLPNPPPLFPFLPIPYPLPLSTPATQAMRRLVMRKPRSPKKFSSYLVIVSSSLAPCPVWSWKK